MRGRKPIPTALHSLRGTTNVTRHRARAAEPKPEGTLHAPPDWLSPEQSASWAYVIAHAPAGVLRMIDRGMLAVWVEAEDRHRRATMQQSRLDVGNAMPLLTRSKDGAAVPSPYLGIITKAASTMIKAASELGFSPASRPRLVEQTGKLAEKTSAWSGLKVIAGGKNGAA